MKGTRRWIVIVVASMLVLLTLFGILLWRLGLFEFTGADASAKIIAATLALIGGLIGSVVTVVGIFLKHSLDQQAERRLKLDSDRNDALRKEAEQRLKLEAAIEAVRLLSTSSGKDVPMTQRAGVLFTLISLEQVDLAINMATQMADAVKIDATTLESLIDIALKSNDEVAQLDALALLKKVGETVLLEEEDRSYFPHCLVGWNPQLPDFVRREGLYCYLDHMLARPYSKWKTNDIESAITCLALVWQNETDELLKNGAGICLEKILNVYAIEENWDLYTLENEPLGIHDIKLEVAGLNDNVSSSVSHGESFPVWFDFIERAEKMDDWTKS